MCAFPCCTFLSSADLLYLLSCVHVFAAVLLNVVRVMIAACVKSKPHLTFLFSLMTTFSCAASTHHSPTFSPLITLLSVLQQWLNGECLLSCMCVVCWHVSE
ncbi:hypothetical protein CIPAW_11G070500 [Carya illinoinensis]|uniref:Uncharacterized protein n=1 Tax=Carya illinoinensis TaxID=32201 RepID=A0A8T1NQQ5_CARIL|nr:hypothetical protein CIPAW_13G119000 [Carya illinoinensis]KAG6635837.1 hypothetical protein CIPAW_11G070500 [Carya illinoinensis]